MGGPDASSARAPHLFIERNNLWALAASGAFFYGLIVVTIVISWRLIKRALPDGHPGIRHPRTGADARPLPA